MKRVRDQVIEQWDRILAGKINAPVRKQLVEDIERCESPMDAVRTVTPDIVDAVIFQFLTFIEEEDERLEFRWDGIDLRDESDGLNGELYSDGWIKRFSNTRPSSLA